MGKLPLVLLQDQSFRFLAIVQNDARFLVLIIVTNQTSSIRLGFLMHFFTSENCWKSQTATTQKTSQASVQLQWVVGV